MKVIGLTGNIGTGKSTVVSRIKSANIKVIDCDVVSREVVEDENVLGILEKEFGEDVLDSNKKLNRKKLGEIVFCNKEKLNKLNSIMHPLMKERIKEYLKEFSKTEKLCIVDGAILIEAGFHDMVEDIILVSASEENQLKRVKARDGFSDEYTKGIIDSQMPLKEKAKYCKYIIDNNEGLEELKQKVDKVIEALLGLEA